MGTLRTDLGGYAFRVRHARRIYGCWTCKGVILKGMEYKNFGGGERRHVDCASQCVDPRAPHGYVDTSAGIPDTGIRM